MNRITKDISFTDLLFQGHSRVIATGVFQTSAGIVVVDPGPSTCLATLRASLARDGISVADVRTILLTHIHLDHAGVTGTLVRENPQIEVFVHERGASHMVDPKRLLESASRLYGADMDRLWGDFIEVPATNVHSLTGGESLTIGDRKLEVAYTPGHASHHVSYLDLASGVAFVGDVAGVRTGKELFTIPPTPPPDIDLETWVTSIARIEKWNPKTLFLTHFGPHGETLKHLRALLKHLHDVSHMVRRTLEIDGSDDDRMAVFTEEMNQYLRQHVSDTEAELYAHAAPFWQCWLGLARYWKKKGVGTAAP